MGAAHAKYNESDHKEETYDMAHQDMQLPGKSKNDECDRLLQNTTYCESPADGT